MAMPADRTTSASAATGIVVKAYKITTKDGLHGTMTVAYVIVTHAYCGAVSRQDRAGAESSMPGLGFWTCATGGCDYFSKF